MKALRVSLGQFLGSGRRVAMCGRPGAVQEGRAAQNAETDAAWERRNRVGMMQQGVYPQGMMMRPGVGVQMQQGIVHQVSAAPAGQIGNFFN